VSVRESLVDRAVDVAVVDVVHGEPRGGLRELVELTAEVEALLVGALGGGRERGQLAVDLLEEFRQLAEVEGAALVLVVGFEELVQAAEVV